MYPITGPPPPDDLAAKPPAYGTVPTAEWLKFVNVEHPYCKATTPCWGWECEPERCQRKPHEDGWHYLGDGDFEIWWRGEA